MLCRPTIQKNQNCLSEKAYLCIQITASGDSFHMLHKHLTEILTISTIIHDKDLQKVYKRWVFKHILVSHVYIWQWPVNYRKHVQHRWFFVFACTYKAP